MPPDNFPRRRAYRGSGTTDRSSDPDIFQSPLPGVSGLRSGNLASDDLLGNNPARPRGPSHTSLLLCPKSLATVPSSGWPIVVVSIHPNRGRAAPFLDRERDS